MPEGGGFGVIMDNLNARCATEFRNVVFVEAGVGPDFASWSGVRGRADVGAGRGGGGMEARVRAEEQLATVPCVVLALLTLEVEFLFENDGNVDTTLCWLCPDTFEFTLGGRS